MFTCNYRERCHFYHELSTKLGLSVFFITNYCHGPGYARCARHLLASTGNEVPRDLYPTQTWRIRKPTSGGEEEKKIVVAGG